MAAPTVPVETKAVRRLREALVAAVEDVVHADRTVRLADQSLHRILDEGTELVVRHWSWVDLARSLAAIAFFGAIGWPG